MFRFKREPKLPPASTITSHAKIAELVQLVETSFEEKFRKALDTHPVLGNAWEVLSISARADSSPLTDEIPVEDGRHIMVRDIISVLETGELSVIE